jgi:hypothetical protein
MLTVDVMVSQDTGVLRLLRMVQIDTSDSTPGLVTGVSWVKTSTDGHYIDADLGAASFGASTASMTYYFKTDTNLGPNPVDQINLAAVGTPVKVGTINVTVPAGGGMLDVRNADAGDPNIGALVIFGHGIDGANPPDPVTILRPGQGLNGGVLSLPVVPTGVNLLSSSPACLGSLWRSQNNFVVLTFDGPAPAVAAGEIVINQLMPGGAFGPDLSSGFTFTPTGNTLRIQQAGAVLTHRTWIAIREANHPGINPFRVNLVVQVGDVNNNGLVNNGDANQVNGGIPCAACPDDRRDINGDNRINNGDTNLVNGRIPSGAVAVTDGHAGTCSPP